MLRVGFRKKKSYNARGKNFFYFAVFNSLFKQRKKKNKVNPEIYKGFKFNVDGRLE